MNIPKLLAPVVILATIYWNYQRTTDVPTDMVMPDIFDPAKIGAEREKARDAQRTLMIAEKKRHRAEDAQYNIEVKAVEKDPRRKRGDNSYCKACDRFAYTPQETALSRTSDYIRLSVMRVHCLECGNLALLFTEKR